MSVFEKRTVLAGTYKRILAYDISSLSDRIEVSKRLDLYMFIPI